jgi:hypothetical protein
MRKIAKITLALSVIALMFTNCKKTEVGPKGDTGAPGINGNANVKTQSFANHAWQYQAPIYYSILNYTAINQNVLDYGQVLVALETSANEYTQLPCTIIYSGYSTLVDYDYFNGGVRVYVSNTLNQQPNLPASNLKFKVTAISGSPLVKKAPDCRLVSHTIQTSN